MWEVSVLGWLAPGLQAFSGSAGWQWQKHMVEQTAFFIARNQWRWICEAHNHIWGLIPNSCGPFTLPCLPEVLLLSSSNPAETMPSTSRTLGDIRIQTVAVPVHLLVYALLPQNLPSNTQLNSFVYFQHVSPNSEYKFHRVGILTSFRSGIRHLIGAQYTPIVDWLNGSYHLQKLHTWP